MIISSQKPVILTCRACRGRFELLVNGKSYNDTMPNTEPIDLIYIGSTHYVTDETHALAEMICVCPRCKAKNKYEVWMPKNIRFSCMSGEV
ncbi:hypothetical protein GJ688_07530 [Heliobacillus mobilis]|uniref:Uncharacterized protein n=1 Tax=Heliobacterium mobile TaxID=28064 RepID=A0A6I3SIX2_HELMO|nr:hypothetical protein [Heliobacterium mobile]MTV48831.1 hypothetical protein [Heliobacterium mobile]